MWNDDEISMFLFLCIRLRLCTCWRTRRETNKRWTWGWCGSERRNCWQNWLFIEDVNKWPVAWLLCVDKFNEMMNDWAMLDITVSNGGTVCVVFKNLLTASSLRWVQMLVVLFDWLGVCMGEAGEIDIRMLIWCFSFWIRTSSFRCFASQEVTWLLLRSHLNTLTTRRRRRRFVIVCRLRAQFINLVGFIHLIYLFYDDSPSSLSCSAPIPVHSPSVVTADRMTDVCDGRTKVIFCLFFMCCQWALATIFIVE